MTETAASTTTELPEGWSVTEFDGLKFITRPDEIIVSVFPAPRHALICRGCGKGLARVRCRWQHRDSMAFDTLRHFDGTGCGEEPRYVSYPDPNCRGRMLGKYEGFVPRFQCYAKSVCTACGSIGTIVNEQRAYGDDVTCTVCGDHHYYSIGD